MSSKRTTPPPGATPDGPAQHRPDPRRQLVQVERLGDVVVRPQVQALGLVGGGAPGGQQDHRDGPALAQLPHDLDAVDAGHDDVEQDDVRPDLLRLLESLLASGGGDHAETLGVQGQGNQLGDAWLVVGHENQGLSAHGPLFAVTCHGPVGRRVSSWSRVPRLLCTDSALNASISTSTRGGAPRPAVVLAPGPGDLPERRPARDRLPCESGPVRVDAGSAAAARRQADHVLR